MLESEIQFLSILFLCHFEYQKLYSAVCSASQRLFVFIGEPKFIVVCGYNQSDNGIP